MKLKLKLNCDRQSVGQSVLVSGAHLGPATNFSFSLKFSLDICEFVIYCTIVSGLCQSNHSWVEIFQNSRPYFTVSFQTLPTWRARSPYLYSLGTGWPSYTPGPFCHLLRLTGLRWRYSNPPRYLLGTVCNYVLYERKKYCTKAILYKTYSYGSYLDSVQRRAIVYICVQCWLVLSPSEFVIMECTSYVDQLKNILCQFTSDRISIRSELASVQDNSVDIATDDWLDGRGSITGRGKRIVSIPQLPYPLWALPASFAMGTGAPSRR
jgi:hypothetical protein